MPVKNPLIAAAAILLGKMRTARLRAAITSSFTARQEKPQREPSITQATSQATAAKASADVVIRQLVGAELQRHPGLAA